MLKKSHVVLMCDSGCHRFDSSFSIVDKVYIKKDMEFSEFAEKIVKMLIEKQAKSQLALFLHYSNCE